MIPVGSGDDLYVSIDCCFTFLTSLRAHSVLGVLGIPSGCIWHTALHEGMQLLQEGGKHRVGLSLCFIKNELLDRMTVRQESQPNDNDGPMSIPSIMGKTDFQV